MTKGRYLATIGVCEACHTPPAVPPTGTLTTAQEQLRSNPDWVLYLDPARRFAGGVPFIIRLSGTSNGVVYSRNITSDVETGIGSWTKAQVIEALRTGRRPDGTSLFLFAPHTFFRYLSEEDADALATYVKSLPAVRYQVNARNLPFAPSAQAPVSFPATSPAGAGEARADYLTRALVGCKECHSFSAGGVEHAWVGGDPRDPFNGAFRLGPDLPLRQDERGFAAFPFPGYAILLGPNLTRFGRGGDLEDVPIRDIRRAIQGGISVQPDRDGRPNPLGHIMMWQFYRSMSNDDAEALASHLKRLTYVQHDAGPGLLYFGANWEAAFERAFGEPPTATDRQAFGKTEKGH
jgi:cytochrome c553